MGRRTAWVLARIEGIDPKERERVRREAPEAGQDRQPRKATAALYRRGLGRPARPGMSRPGRGRLGGLLLLGRPTGKARIYCIGRLSLGEPFDAVRIAELPILPFRLGPALVNQPVDG